MHKFKNYFENIHDGILLKNVFKICQNFQNMLNIIKKKL